MFKPSETPRNAVHGTLAGRVHKSIDQSSQMALKGTKSADQTTSESRQELTKLDTDMKHFHFKAKLSLRTLGMYIVHILFI